jgi:hypothetical protein
LRPLACAGSHIPQPASDFILVALWRILLKSIEQRMQFTVEMLT